MRYLVLTRGAPGSGKSTWIERMGLEPFVLSSDAIRLMFRSPSLDTKGSFFISQKNDRKVWDLLFSFAEEKMKHGDFIVVDATHYKASLISRYREMAEKNRYRVVVVDFTKVPKETCLKNNKLRPLYKQVPDSVIEKMYAVFNDDKEKRNWYETIQPEDFTKRFTLTPLDITEKYDYIEVFGDIHGCYEPLREHFSKHPFNERTFYVFLGDYVDRGLQNKEVLDFLMTIYNKSNVLMLEGNHEKWLRLYIQDDLDSIRSPMFKLKTIPQISSIDKKQLSNLVRKFAQLGYFKFGEKDLVFTHGGIPSLPNYFVSTEDYIKGVGNYSEDTEIARSFSSFVNTLQFFGHRKLNRETICVPLENLSFSNSYNLCRDVEGGKDYCVGRIDKQGKVDFMFYKNPVFSSDFQNIEENKNTTLTDAQIIQDLVANDKILKKQLENDIYSFNYKREIFYTKAWDALTSRARGLFIHLPSNKIIARSYDKFFNQEEREETKLENLQSSLQYPVKAFKKENGFLGLLSYDFTTDGFFIASKSTNKGPFAEWFKRIITPKLTNELKNYLKENNVTFVFEVIDPVNDPHIIKYEKEKVVLLDVIKNQFKFEVLNNYEEIAKKFNFEAKKLVKTLNSFVELSNFLEEVQNIKYEGFVFQARNNFMFKHKSKYYKFWKDMRGIVRIYASSKKLKTSYVTAEEIYFTYFLKTLIPSEVKEMSLIELREKFYSTLKDDVKFRYENFKE